MTTTASRIKDALELRHMKQSELSKRTGINKGSLSCYISGAYSPKQNNIYLIAKALNVSEAWLMGYDVPIDRIPDSERGRDDREEFVRLYDQSSPEMRNAAIAVLKAGLQNASNQ